MGKLVVTQTELNKTTNDFVYKQCCTDVLVIKFLMSSSVDLWMRMQVFLIMIFLFIMAINLEIYLVLYILNHVPIRAVNEPQMIKYIIIQKENSSL